MDISVVIVNYNVKHFLEQCLHSVEKALENLKGEVLVVDNNSVDGSCQMVKQKFPNVNLIENKNNSGFSKANNQAIKQCKGRYVLLLNPDTLIQEDTLKKCIGFCDKNEDAGGLGVKMIDGKGHFLPESKRGLPTPMVSFYKIFGLSLLFPKSKIFAKYHLGNLDKDKIHKVEILAGAFMLLRKRVLDEIGLLDESFFMYGEDIDLSYRIIKAGYRNYYYPETTIIHYKGESTKKGSINYVLVFYKAMIIFAKKHFSSKNAKLYSFFINVAVYLRAAIGIIQRILSKTFKPVADFLIIYAGFRVLIPYWEKFQFNRTGYYPESLIKWGVPSYILVWMFFLFVFGAYEKKVKTSYLFKGIIGGSISILVIYALLPEALRYSRALIVFGTLWVFISTLMVRWGATTLFKTKHALEFKNAEKRIAIVGSKIETNRVKTILLESGLNYTYVGRIKEKGEEEESLGAVGQLEEIVRINRIDELVFCSKDMSAAQIIRTMLIYNRVPVSYKIAPPEGISVIGSNSINTAGDLYVVDINSLAKGMNKRKKRMFDMVSSAILLALSPLLVFIIPRPTVFLGNCFRVLAGTKSWVGISLDGHHGIQSKEIKPGVLRPSDGLKRENLTPGIKERLNILYAKDYKLSNDFMIVLRSFRHLGRKA